MTKVAVPTHENDSEADEQLTNLVGFLDILVQIDLANRNTEN
jgi:hypothetical protein